MELAAAEPPGSRAVRWLAALEAERPARVGRSLARLGAPRTGAEDAAQQLFPAAAGQRDHITDGREPASLFSAALRLAIADGREPAFLSSAALRPASRAESTALRSEPSARIGARNEMVIPQYKLRD